MASILRLDFREVYDSSMSYQPVRAWLVCDTFSDLPASTVLDSRYEMIIGSKCHVVATGKNYEMKSDGTWVEIIPDSVNYTYTKAEIDTMLSALEDAIDLDEAVLSNQLDSGAKNKCPVNSGSNTLPTRWLQIPLVLPAGVYKLKIENLVSDDSDASTCQFVFFDSSNNAVSNYLYLNRGDDVSGTLTLTGESSYCRLYPSDSYAHSENDTVTATDIMICDYDEYQISSKYVPYCPTLYELYQMVRGYHP